MLNRRLKNLPVAVTLVGAMLGLAGCYSTSDFDRRTPSEVPTPPSPAAAFEVGDELPESIAAELRRDVQNDDKAYQLSDGTYILTGREDPLPQSVRQDIITAVSSILGNPQDIEEYVSTGPELGTFLEEARLSTGKKLLVLTPVCYPLEAEVQPDECHWRTEASPDRSPTQNPPKQPPPNGSRNNPIPPDPKRSRYRLLNKHLKPSASVSTPKGVPA